MSAKKVWYLQSSTTSTTEFEFNTLTDGIEANRVRFFRRILSKWNELKSDLFRVVLLQFPFGCCFVANVTFFLIKTNK